MGVDIHTPICPVEQFLHKSNKCKKKRVEKWNFWND